MKKIICLITSFLSIFASTSASLFSVSSNSNTTINNNQTQNAQSLINSLNDQINSIKQKVEQLKERTRLLKDQISQEEQKTMQLDKTKSELSSKLQPFEQFKKIVNDLITTLDLPEDLAKKEDFTQKVLAILEFYKNTIKNIDDENDPNSFKKLFDKLIELEEKITRLDISFEQVKKERSNLEEANRKLNGQISETRKNIESINKSITESINRKQRLESEKRELESEIDINKDKVIKLQTKVSEISEFIYKIANNIWDEKFKDHLLESESFIQIGKEFENELNKMLDKKVSLNIVNQKKNPTANTKDTDNRETEKLKFTISDILFEFELGIVWPDRNKQTNYENSSNNKCIEIGYVKTNDKKYILERLNPNTKEVPFKLPRFITSLKEAFKDNKHSHIEGIQHWNTKNITDMSRTFERARNFNQDISDWDMSNVTITESMFFEAEKFNKNLNDWNMSKVTDSRYMFGGATDFNGNISNWDMYNVQKVTNMFIRTQNFNQDLSNWILNNVTNKSEYNNLLKDTKIKDDQSKWPRVMRDSHQQSDNKVFIGRIIIENILKVVWKNNFTNRQVPALRKYLDVIPSYSKKINDFLQDAPFKGIDIKLSEQQENERFPLLNNQPENRGKTFDVTVKVNNSSIRDTFSLPVGEIDETRSIAEYNKEKTECIVIGFAESLGVIKTDNVPPTVRKVPKLLPPQITSIENMFFKSEQQSIENIDQWDTRNITNMSDTFKEARKFNQNINSWNTANVKFFNRTFNGAESFNQPLSNWKVANSLSFSLMFAGASDFNQPLNSWRFNTKDHFKMDWIFHKCTNFNQDLDQWNVENLNNAEHMFDTVFSFNGKVSTWKTNSLTRLDYMFHKAKNFNRRVYDWNIQRATTFRFMFFECSRFLQPLDSWYVSIGLVGESTESFKSRVQGMLDNTPLVQHGIYPWYPHGMVQHRVYPTSPRYDNHYPGHPED
ncbi:BspA family leucine-rich repeat surface protein [Mycoplasma sp. HU2014]|uniref:BspA family leucine-rich repeat surface protein n=1 Tax=Mycoplasma sp. HU2014 TaxID=1664275 RepID=UPI00067AA639|nr:BspA family leucine-rich repeat surface protein [Mycoplasma sp. HU2014]KNG79685.1 PARCEL domain-containing protein [Mycoplasma sp. HU2014]